MPSFCQFGRQAPEEAIVVAGADPADKVQGPEIRPEVPKEAPPAQAPGHHRFGDPGLLEGADEFPQLAHGDPVALPGQRLQGRVGLALVGHRHHLQAPAPGRPGKEQGELPLTRD